MRDLKWYESSTEDSRTINRMIAPVPELNFGSHKTTIEINLTELGWAARMITGPISDYIIMKRDVDVVKKFCQEHVNRRCPEKFTAEQIKEWLEGWKDSEGRMEYDQPLNNILILLECYQDGIEGYFERKR